MSQTVGDFFVERLHEWGVRRIFGYPGDGINGVLGSLQRDKDKHKIEFIQVRHEEMAAFMACAYAKFGCEIGVCLSTGGPGASHIEPPRISPRLQLLRGWSHGTKKISKSCSPEVTERAVRMV
jgi:hypothetical protein